MFKDLLFLIDNGESSDRARETELARCTLRALDDYYRDAIWQYRSRPPIRARAGIDTPDTQLLRKNEELYCRWRAEFDVRKSLYPDELFRRLRDIAGPGATVSEHGFTLWRIRLLDDDERPQVVPVSAMEDYSVPYAVLTDRESTLR